LKSHDAGASFPAARDAPPLAFPRNEKPIEPMKTSIPTLLVAALVATVSAATAAESRVRLVNHGRAGQVTTPERYTPRTVQHGGGTTVALTMEKPGKPVNRVQTMGRAGYRLSAQPPQRR
jgi:hypothetical protein